MIDPNLQMQIKLYDYITYLISNYCLIKHDTLTFFFNMKINGLYSVTKVMNVDDF